MVAINRRYQKVFDYRFYRLIKKLDRYDDNVASEIRKMRRKVAVQMKSQAYNGKASRSRTNILTEFKCACDSSCIHEGSAVWLFQTFVNCHALVAIKTRLAWSHNYATSHDEPITAYVEVLNHILKRYVTDADIARAGEDIHKFKQG